LPLPVGPVSTSSGGGAAPAATSTPAQEQLVDVAQ